MSEGLIRLRSLFGRHKVAEGSKTNKRAAAMAEKAEADFSVAVTGDAIPDESVLLERLKSALGRGTSKVNIISSYVVETDSAVRVLTGPVLGEITCDSAILLVEVQGPSGRLPITCKLYKEDDSDEPVQSAELLARSKRPLVFHFRDLEPGTRYTAVLNGVCKYHATGRMARFRTKSEDIRQFRLLALSCDRPSRLLLGQQDPWQHMLRRMDGVDCVLHVGDQIYPDNEGIANADHIFNDIFDGLSEAKQRSMMLRGRELWRDKYRSVFSRQAKADVMARASNLMIWSDNDVANDFTTMKRDGDPETQMYHPNFLQCGMRTYREYQRRLWDADCDLGLAEETAEWHAHVYGPVGVFMLDLRGNRITGDGRQMSDNPLLSDAQWVELEDFFARPELRFIVLCSETPFLGDEPGVCREKVASAESMSFLKDHWSYNESELLRLLDLCFAWKADGETTGRGRDLLLIGGDIHCGVTSIVRDEETGLQIQSLTTSPVTNHVCKFFPPPEGQISERYNFSHLPLGQKFRNYADVSVVVGDDEVQLNAKLVPISTDIFKDTTWKVEDSEEE